MQSFLHYLSVIQCVYLHLEHQTMKAVLKYLDQVFLSVLAHFGSPETNASNSAQEGFILCKEYSLWRMNECRVDSHSLCFLLDAVMFFMYPTLHHMS